MRKKTITFFTDISYCLKLSFVTSKLYTIIRIVIQILKALFPIIGVYIFKLILDSLAIVDKPSALSAFIVFIVLYLVIQVLTQWLTKLDEYFRQIHEGLIENHITRGLNEKASKIDISFFDSPTYYDRIQLLRSNIYAINQMLWNVVSLFSNVITFITAFIIMIQFNVLYTGIIILSYIPIALCDQIYIKKLYNWQTEKVGEQRKMSYVSNLILQKTHSKNIRIFGLADYLVDIYTGLWKAWFASRKVIVKKWSAISLLLSTVPEILTILVLVSVGTSIINGQNSIGDFSLYSGIIGQLVASVFIMIYNISNIFENKVRIKDYKEFNSWINRVEGTGRIELNHIKKIVFTNVTFTYPGNNTATLKNLNFEIKEKERIALVGINGAGKTTLIKLLLRFYDVSEGEILINDINIKEYTPESIRKHFTVMFQDYVNYAFTLRENIRISDITRQYSDEDIIEACKKSGVDQIFWKFGKGLDNYIYKEFEESGIELSGGENQKIALGRTFFRGGEFIILDEPSSSLDAESEYILFKKMLELCNGKGVILISHRLSNVILADRIFVIEDGKMIEQGTHTELMLKDGRYATLYRYQVERYNIT